MITLFQENNVGFHHQSNEPNFSKSPPLFCGRSGEACDFASRTTTKSISFSRSIERARRDELINMTRSTIYGAN